MIAHQFALISLLATFAFTAPFNFATAEEAKPQPQSTQLQAQAKKKFQFVLHVSDEDPKIWRQALQNAEAMQRNMGRENVDVEIVANGYGLDMLKNESKVTDLINGALDRSVDVVACGETMERTGVKKSDLIGGVRVVKGGLPEIALKVRAGWTYIKP
jgi:intracellular sulfur oxidation DsrE/DsrF family protein